MPSKLWDDATDWADWTLSGLEISGDSLAISAGSNSGTATLTDAFEASSWDHHSKFILNGTRPRGTNIYVRVRTGATEVACESASWSDYIDGLDENGRMSFDLRAYWLNEGVTEGAWIQYEITLVGE